MEEKLKEFKIRKRRENLLNKGSEVVSTVFNMFSSKSNSDDVECDRLPLLSEQRSTVSSPVLSEGEQSIATSDVSLELSWTRPDCFTISTYFLYTLLWVTLYLIAIQLEFGYVYLVLSGLFFIYFNTRTGPKKEGEVSAYSVFNPNCKAIDGTLKAEQFEKEFNLIRHDPSSPNK